MTELYVNDLTTLPDPSGDPDLLPMRVAQSSPLLVREEKGTRNLAATNAVPNWVHAPGDLVLVRSTPTLTVTHTLAVRPQSGTVTAVGSGVATVSALGQSWSLRYVGTAPSVSQVVAITWGSEGGVVQPGSLSGTITPPAGTALGTLPTSSGPVTLPPFRPTESGTYRSGTKRSGVGSSVYQGHWVAPASSADNTGIVCFGDVWGAVRGKTVALATITVIRGDVGIGVNGAVTVHLKTHNVTTLPTATPALNASTNNTLTLSPNQSGTTDVTAMVQEIANNTAAGFAVTYAGTTDYAQFLGVGPSDSFVVTVTVQ